MHSKYEYFWRAYELNEYLAKICMHSLLRPLLHRSIETQVPDLIFPVNKTVAVYAHGIDAIYHPRTTKIVLPANALISEAIRSLYRSAYYRGRRGGVGRGNHMLTKTLPPS